MYLNHHNQHDPREDVYTISNPMTYPHSFAYGGALGNKSTTMETQPAEISHETWLQLDDSPLSTAPRSNTLELKESHMPRKRSHLKYIINAVLFIFVVLFCGGVELGIIPYLQLPFVCKDPKLSYKYRGDSVRMSTLLAITILMPICIFLGVEYTRARNEWKKILGLMCRWFKYAVLVNVVMVLFIVEAMKIMLGEPRPHFFDSCRPDAAATCREGDLVENYKCTNTQLSSVIIIDSSRSFPSGHAAVSVFTSLYCAAYIYYRLKMPSLGSVLKPFLISATMIWALGCSLTRITDHRHHWWDVLAGMVIGAICALFTSQCLVEKFKSKPRTSNSVSSTTLWNGKDCKDDVCV